MNTIQQQGDEMVEMFMPFAYYNTESVNVLKEQVSNATRIAIAHCKLVIEVLETNLHNDFDILNRRGEYLAILQELKNMNQ